MSRPPLRVAAAALVVAVVATACGGDPEPAASPSPSVAPSPELPEPSPTPTETELTGPPRPLNGLPVEEGTDLDRRVIAVKIDNHELARPQTGLDRADAVYELVVEAGLTRFIALFHAHDADAVGPMRSGRPSDPTLVKPLGATFTISGAQPWVIDAIQSAGVPLIGDIGEGVTFRSANRPAPHNLYTDTNALREEADRRGYPDVPPPTWFTFEPWSEVVGEEAETVSIGFSNTTNVTWTWNGEAYERSQGGASHGYLTPEGDTEPIAADTLVVLEADLYTAQPPGRGTAVPAVDTVGSGRVVVLSGGRAREGTWSRASGEEPFTLLDDAGEPLPLPPGKLWISLLPSGRALEIG